MTLEELNNRLRGTVWEGGARYWRGKVQYRPMWVVIEIVHESNGLGIKCLFARVKRMDNNAAVEPAGTIRRIALHCFEGFNRYGTHTYRMRRDIVARKQAA